MKLVLNDAGERMTLGSKYPVFTSLYLKWCHLEFDADYMSNVRKKEKTMPEPFEQWVKNEREYKTYLEEKKVVS